ncbi:MAG: hypothetical protein N3E49_09485 [Bacteroidia bacterium]|nr:hypothetical protein [Bacteroidia bacterium]
MNTTDQLTDQFVVSPLDQLVEGIFLAADALFRIAANYAKVPEEAVTLQDHEKEVLREPLKAYIISKAGENVKPEYALLFAALGVLLPRVVLFLQSYTMRNKALNLRYGRSDHRQAGLWENDVSPPTSEGSEAARPKDNSGIRTEWVAHLIQDSSAGEAGEAEGAGERGDSSG